MLRPYERGIFVNRHHRRSIRLKGYDYASAGAYFVTVCTQGRAVLFGEVAAGEMVLSEYGEIVARRWEDIPRHFQATLDAWVVMPNHVHGIIVITGMGSPSGRGEASAVHGRPQGVASGSLAAIVQNVKAVSTRRINALRGSPGGRVWQRNYYEHIIRNERELWAIQAYIESNPMQWGLDRENPDIHRAMAR
jgi:REP element-mobilizing transposase RayT